ncbi:hypothetical protein E2320_003244 [Naja naja]|nr:hypothetical protein E2320_003244 [Naja naja]
MGTTPALEMLEIVFVENPDFPRYTAGPRIEQVAYLKTIIEKNLPRALPRDWVSNESKPVIWRPSAHPSEPPLEWLSALWTFLTHHASSLEPFKGCPVIPLTHQYSSLRDVQLARLLPHPTLIFQRLNGQCLPDAVAGILEVLGCTVIQNWDSSWSHHQLKEYVLEPTPSNVLQAFVHLGLADVENHLTFLSSCQIESLSAFLSTASSFSKKDIRVLTNLPLFFKMPSLLPPSKPGLVSAQDYLALEKTLVPPLPTHLLTPEPVLLCRNEAERSLLFKIRGKLLGTLDLCLLCVRAMKKGFYANQAEDAKQFMLWLLHNGDTLFSQSRELQALCCDLPFVDCGSTELLRPSSSAENRALGLKSDLSAVSPADAISAAREVNVSETATAKAKSQALIRVCNESPLLSHLPPEMLKQLRSLPWVPAINFSKCGPAGVFLAPESIRSEKYAALVGQVMGLTNAFWFHAAEKLGLEFLPPPKSPANSALYCDMDRARLADLGEDRPILVHKAVSSATAAFFGVEMLSTKLSGLELFEAWGPSEPITLRIRNILREYSQDADVFQELLQNAEDAGAQTCRFLIDLRQHDTTKGLLDPGMAACQGPALWAQNDALFTEADFSNVTQLGAATKEHQENKIGRFGLGFCTVYHMTDVPFLLSGHTVLIFDPNITHLQKHIRGSARPGIRLNLTSTEAKESQICPEPFGPSRIKGLKTGFQEMSQYLLIFLHNVQEVSLSCLSHGSSSPEVVQPLATVSREVLDEMGFPLIRLRTTWQSAMDIHHFLLHSCSADGEAKELFRKGRKRSIHFMPPSSRVALPLRPSTTIGRWLPDINGFKGRVFCSLPLPIESGLPLHLTAPFAVLSNRKGLWDTTEKGQWNIALLRDSVTAAWLGALTRLRDMYKQELLEDYEYYDFWPDVYSIKYPFTEAAKAFYRALIDGVNGEQPVLFSDGQKWCPLNHACILDDDIICETQLSSVANRAFSLLLSEPQIAVSLPEKVKLSIKTFTSTNSSMLNTYNWARFLQELVLPNLAKLAVPDRNALILRALDDE